LGKGFKNRCVIVHIGTGGCDITQASRRRSRLDCVSLFGTAKSTDSECVTSGNVANPIKVANARREGKYEEDIKRIRCMQEHSSLVSPSIAVVNENRFALND